MAKRGTRHYNGGVSMFYIKRHITWGNILVAIDDNVHIAGVWFEGQKYHPSIPEGACFIEALSRQEQEATMDKTTLDKIGKLIDAFDQQIREYEAGIRDTFDLPLAPVGGEFRQQVWEILQEIPLGKTTTYGAIASILANKLGKQSMSAQAVGGAVGHNPISLIIPCHRVVGARGQLTGYAGGVDKKTALLQHEGIRVEGAYIAIENKK